RYAREGAWASKQEAGRWALAAVPEAELVRRALEARAGGAAVEPAAAGAFLTRVREAVLAAAG
ncbi:MAG TPA: aminoglycoside adenylyltransferase domain-containing protein, partial [Gaiellaceae bacterium]|nr:aminoglycoside adenylyltransferase domain-containing protein [Gaiellaceae bacterium]